MKNTVDYGSLSDHGVKGENPLDDHMLFDMLPGLALMAGANGRLIRANKNVRQIKNFQGNQGSPGSLADMCHPDDQGKMESAREKALERGNSEVTVRLATDHDKYRWYRLHLQSHDEESGESFLLVTGSDETHRVRNDRRLNMKQAILSSLFCNAGVGMVLLDRGDRIMEANEGFMELFGYEEKELRGKYINQVLAPDGEQLEAAKDVTSRAGQAGSSRYRPGVVSKNGTPLAVLVDEVPVTGRDHANLRYQIFTDVTSLEQQRSRAQGSAEEQKALLREVHHRVMNNLDLATGFLQLQMYETEDPAVRRALTDTVVRIKSLAMIHDIFRDSGSVHQVDMQIYLENLVVFLRQVRDRTEGAGLECRIGELQMHVERAVPCALLINELAGVVLEQDDARDAGLNITLEREHSEYNLQLRERGGALGSMFGEKDGYEDLRHEIVQALLRQLDARVVRDSRNGHTQVAIRFPADRSPRSQGKSWPIFGT